MDIALARLEATGKILRGSFTPGFDEEEFCDRRTLARIHRETIGRLRKQVEPVSAATFIRFLFRWQHVSSASQLHGEGGLLDVVEQLQGFETPAAAWESEILPQRVAGYKTTLLDELCLSGEVVWGRFAGRNGDDGPTVRAAFARNVPISLAVREALPWLLRNSAETNGLVGAPAQVLAFLRQQGASFMTEIAAGTRRLQTEVENTLWQLAAAGLVTADGFAAVRGVANGAAKRLQRSARFRRRPRQRRPGSRWSVLTAPAVALPASEANGGGLEVASARDKTVEAIAMQLLLRYGIVFPELLAREAAAPRWRELLRVYRRAEARGEIRGGRFASGFVGEQFALPEAVEMMRSVRRKTLDGDLSVVSACDPLNLAGILDPGSARHRLAWQPRRIQRRRAGRDASERRAELEGRGRRAHSLRGRPSVIGPAPFRRVTTATTVPTPLRRFSQGQVGPPTGYGSVGVHKNPPVRSASENPTQWVSPQVVIRYLTHLAIGRIMDTI